MASTHDGDLNKVYARLFSTGELSDVTVRCGSGMTRAHKVILYGKSEYFRKIIDNDSSDHVSSASYEINLGAYMGSELVYKALEFIYVGDYKPGASELLAQLKGFVEDPDSSKPKEHGDPKPVNHPWVNIHSEKELLMHLVLYQLAEKLQIPGFEDTIIKKFESACKMFWDSDSFVETVVQLFMEGLHEDKFLDAISRTIATHLDELIRKPEIRKVLHCNPDFAVKVLEQKAEELQAGN